MSRRHLLLGLGILLLGWLVVAELVVPTVAARADRFQELPTAWLHEAAATAESFLEYWKAYSRAVSAFLAVTCALVWLVGWAPFQEYVTRAQGSPPPTPPPAMGRGRLWTVHGLIALVVGGSLLATLSGVELWPFSPYKMYSQLQVGSTARWRLYGASADGEVDLSRVSNLTPFDASRLFWAMQQVERRGEQERVMEPIARYVWGRYEAARQTGAVGGPPLEAIRLYRLTWLIEKPPLKATPDTTELMYEWREAP